MASTRTPSRSARIVLLSASHVTELVRSMANDLSLSAPFSLCLSLSRPHFLLRQLQSMCVQPDLSSRRCELSNKPSGIMPTQTGCALFHGKEKRRRNAAADQPQPGSTYHDPAHSSQRTNERLKEKARTRRRGGQELDLANSVLLCWVVGRLPA